MKHHLFLMGLCCTTIFSSEKDQRKKICLDKQKSTVVDTFQMQTISIAMIFRENNLDIVQSTKGRKLFLCAQGNCSANQPSFLDAEFLLKHAVNQHRALVCLSCTLIFSTREEYDDHHEAHAVATMPRSHKRK